MASHELVPGPGSGHGSPNGRYGAAHERARDAYRGVPILQRPLWHNEVAAYFFCGGISSGAFVLAALASLCGGPRRHRLARLARYVSFAALVPCPPLLIDDLGRPSRFHHMLRIVKPSSPMNLGAWALTVHGALAAAAAARALAGQDRLPAGNAVVRLLPERLLSLSGIPSALALGGYTGVLLGTTSIPVWYTSPLLGGLFMASSMSTGTAAVTVAATLTGQSDGDDYRLLARLTAASGATELVLLGGYLITSGRAAGPLLRGRNALLMAGAAVGLATATVLDALSARSRGEEQGRGLAAAVATLAAGALLRWVIVGAGRHSAEDREGTLEAMQPTSRAPGWSV